MAAQVLLNAQNTSSYGDTVSWSSDGRIAVVANEVVYIIVSAILFGSGLKSHCG